MAYQLHLSHFMRGKIESTVDTLLQQGEKYDFSLFLNIPASNIFQVHMKSGQYPIGNLIIAQFFTYTRYPDLIRSFHPQQWHPYFAFLRTSLLANPHDPYIMKVVDNLYNRVKDRQSILALFVELVRELAGEWEAKEEREGEGERERELVRLERSREIY